MIVFEDWIEKPFSRANQKQESAINLAELYWQGLDPRLKNPYAIWSIEQIKFFYKIGLEIKIISMGCNIKYWI